MAEAFVDDIGLFGTPAERPGGPIAPVKPSTEFVDDIGLFQPKPVLPVTPLPTPTAGTAMQTRFEESKQAAGPRGSTFAGRLVQKGSTETPEQVLQRVPLGELEAGGLAATAPLDLAAGLALGAGVTKIIRNPAQAAQAVANAAKSIPGISGKYSEYVDKIGHAIVERMPKSMRAGRGTPIKFRETVGQKEADIANSLEQAITLGTSLKTDLTRGERLRIDQLLRGSQSSAESRFAAQASENLRAKGVNPAAPAYSKDIDMEIDRIAAIKAKELRPPTEFDPSTGLPVDQIATGSRGRPMTQADEDRMYSLVRPVRKEIDRLQDELIKLGHLSPETVERFQDNYGPYLARLYSSKEFVDKAVVPFGQPVRAGTDRLKMRGERVEVELPKKINPESSTERVEALDKHLKDGYTVEARDGRKVTLFRDIPEEIRTAPAGQPVMKDGKKIGTGMGELRDQPGYTAAKSIAQAGREAGVVKFFKSVSDNPEWTSTGAKPGFVEMTGDKKTLADLSGKFVRSDIAAEINDAVAIKQDWQKILHGINSLWKVGKVTNPATIARNFMSSAEIARWGGLSYASPTGWRTYETTIDGLLGKNKVTAGFIDEAKKSGVYRSGWQQAEINALADGFVKSKAENPLVRLLEGVQNSAVMSKTGKFYGSVDSFYKSALYVHARQELGMTPQLATRYAKKYGIDYGDVSPFVKAAREIPLGSPFITFGAKAIPLFIETVAKHPVRALGLPGVVWGMSELSKRSFGEDGEAEISKMQEMGSLRSPRYAVLPSKDAEGRNQFLDLGYVLPFGDVLEIIDRARGGGGTSISLEPFGGPFQSIAETAFNKSMFTDKEIWKDTDNYSERYAKISDHVLKSLLPAFAPPIPGTGFRGGYSVEEFRKALAPEFQLPLETPLSKTDFLGRQRDLTATIASKVLGINVKNVSMMDLKRLGLIEFNSKLEQLNKQMTRMTLMDITEEQKKTQVDKLSDKYRALVEETQKKFAPPETKQKAAAPEFVDDLGLMKKAGNQ